MNALETAALVYFVAGITCWLLLVVAYARRSTRSRAGAGHLLVKSAVALPVVAAWPLLVLALLRRESAARVRGEQR